MLLEIQRMPIWVHWFVCGCAMIITSKSGVHWLCGILLVLFLFFPHSEGHHTMQVVKNRTAQA